MVLEFNLGISSNSVWKIATPTAQARKLPFYLIEYGHFLANETYFTKRMGVDMYLLFATISGKGLMIYDGKEMIFGPGSIAVISCNKEHLYRTLSEDTWEFKWIFFNGQAAATFESMVNSGNIFVCESADIHQFIESMDTLQNNFMSQDLLDSLKTSETITQLLTMLVTHRIKESRGSLTKSKQKIESVTVYLNKHYCEKITIDEMADICYYSKFHFIRFFKSQLGINPYEYLTNIRLNKAKELLILTQKTISEIAEETGFCDSKNLIAHFKTSTSLSPGKYRKLHKRIEI